MTKTTKTIREALALRQAENDAFNARCDSRAVEAKRIHNLMQDNPQIGVLNRDGKTVYYTFPAGGVYKEAKKIEALIIPVSARNSDQYNPEFLGAQPARAGQDY